MFSFFSGYSSKDDLKRAPTGVRRAEGRSPDQLQARRRALVDEASLRRSRHRRGRHLQRQGRRKGRKDGRGRRWIAQLRTYQVGIFVS